MWTKSRCVCAAVFLAFLLAATGCAKAIPVEETDPPGSLYETEEAVRLALSAVSAGVEEAGLLTDANTISRVVFLTFDGLADVDTMTALLDLLDRYEMKATFFLPGLKSAEAPDAAALPAARGQEIGSYTFTATPGMHNKTEAEIAEDLARTSAILRNVTGQEPKAVLCRSTVYTPTVLQAVRASGAEFAVQSGRNLSYQSLVSQEAALDYVQGLERGTVISLKLDAVLDEFEYAVDGFDSGGQTGEPAAPPQFSPEQDSAFPTDFIRDSVWVDPVHQDGGERNRRLLMVAEYLLYALHTGGYECLPVSRLPELHEDFGVVELTETESTADVLRQARTTVRGVGLAFENIQDAAQVESVLQALADAGATATFFVTAREADDYPATVQAILDGGHILENSGVTGEDLSEKTAEAVSAEIARCAEFLTERYGVQTRLFMPSGAKLTDAAVLAAAAQDHVPSLYNKNPAGQGALDPESLASYLRQGFQRGDIVYCPLNRSDNWAGLIPVLARTAAGSGCRLMPVRELYENQYPTYPLESIAGWNSIRINGNFDQNADNMNRIVYEVATGNRVIFLTFDDWGSDGTITGLLDTLYRYGAKASFFARANGVEKNPNLCRAIYEQGHDVLSHSYAHNAISDISVSELQSDSTKAHQILTQTLGAAPPLIYRAPTMYHEVEKINALYASGFRYIAASNLSTHDYERTAREVADMVLAEAKPGAIVVMHMSDNAVARAAMDLFMPELLAQGYTFPRLSDYL